MKAARYFEGVSYKGGITRPFVEGKGREEYNNGRGGGGREKKLLTNVRVGDKKLQTNVRGDGRRNNCRTWGEGEGEDKRNC